MRLCTEPTDPPSRRSMDRGTPQQSTPKHPQGGMERDAYRLRRAILHGIIVTQNQRDHYYERQGRVRHKQRRKPKCCRLAQPPRRLIPLVRDQSPVRGIACNFGTVVAYTKPRSSQESQAHLTLSSRSGRFRSAPGWYCRYLIRATLHGSTA